MTEFEQAEENLAASLKKLPLDVATALVTGAMTIAFGDDGLEALQACVCKELEEEECLKSGLR
jgi:hypothetical protein